MTEDKPTPEPQSSKDPASPSKPNFAGALLLGVLLVIAWGFNLAAVFIGGEPVVPGYLLYVLMGGILVLLGVDVSKLLSRRSDP